MKYTLQIFLLFIAGWLIAEPEPESHTHGEAEVNHTDDHSAEPHHGEIVKNSHDEHGILVKEKQHELVASEQKKVRLDRHLVESDHSRSGVEELVTHHENSGEHDLSHVEHLPTSQHKEDYWGMASSLLPVDVGHEGHEELHVRSDPVSLTHQRASAIVKHEHGSIHAHSEVASHGGEFTHVTAHDNFSHQSNDDESHLSHIDAHSEMHVDRGSHHEVHEEPVTNGSHDMMHNELEKRHHSDPHDDEHGPYVSHHRSVDELVAGVHDQTFQVMKSEMLGDAEGFTASIRQMLGLMQELLDGTSPHHVQGSHSPSDGLRKKTRELAIHLDRIEYAHFQKDERKVNRLVGKLATMVRELEKSAEEVGTDQASHGATHADSHASHDVDHRDHHRGHGDHH